jgi:hypothetical protein
MMLVEYGFVGIRTQRPSQDEEFVMSNSMGVWDGCTKIWNCQSVQMCLISQCEIRLSEILAACQVSLPITEPCLEMKPEYRNKTYCYGLRLMLHFHCQVNSICYTQYSLCAVLVTAYWSNTEFFWIQLKTGNKNNGDEKFVFSLRHYLKICNAEINA